MKEFTFSQPVNIDTLPATLSQLTGSPIITGGTIDILNNGDEFFPSLYTDLEGAKTSIEFSVYIWKKGVVSTKVCNLLIQKAKQGVQVRLLLDSFGAQHTPANKIAELKKAGGMVAWYHPLKFGLLMKFFKRNHSRSITIDNTISYTGGMAIADYWLGHAQDKNHWRDIMFRLKGPIIHSVQEAFTNIWTSVTGEILVASPITTPPGNEMLSIGYVNASPDQDMEQLSAFFATTIAAARVSIDIVTPYLILQPRLKKQLINAVQRGVTVRLLLPGRYIDSKIVQAASQYSYNALLRGGIKIFEYKPTMIHAKLLVVDGVWSIIGSANIDTRSTFYNVENNIGIADEKFAAKLQSIIHVEITNAREIKVRRWQRRFIFRKIAEFFATIPDEQF
ncbi:MAG: phospholipase D-like domain-containing protein [Candidatus Paceibacterota bacterium]